MKKVVLCLLIMIGIQLKAKSVYVGNPLSSTDNTSQIRSSIAKLEDNDYLVFPANKTFIINGNANNDIKWKGGGQIFRLIGKKNITILGNRSILSIKKWGNAFYLQDCKNITIRDLTVSGHKDHLPYVKGTVTKKTSTYIHLKPIAPYITAVNMGSTRLYKWDDKNDKVAFDGYSLYDFSSINSLYAGGNPTKDGTTIVTPGTMKVPIASYYNQAKIKVNDVIILCYRDAIGAAFNVVSTDGFTLYNVVANGLPGRTLFAEGTSNIIANRVYSKPLTGYDVSACSDIMHFKFCRGNLNISNSHFIQSGDDAINVHSNYFRVRNVNKVMNYIDFSFPEQGQFNGDKHFSKFFYDDNYMPKEGDVFEMSTRDDPFWILESLTVKSAAKIKDGLGNVTRVRVFFTSISKNYKNTDYGINVNAVPSKVVIYNNYFKAVNGRGVVLHGRNATMDKNHFAWCSGPGIQLRADVNWFYEGPIPQNVKVSNTVISQCNYAANFRDLGQFTTSLLKRTASNYKVNETKRYTIDNISIDKVSIRGRGATDEVGFGIQNANNLSIDNSKDLGGIKWMFDSRTIGCDVKLHRKTREVWNPFKPIGTPSSIRFKKTIQAEDFDKGTGLFGHADLYAKNYGNIYRTDVSAEIYKNGTNNYMVSSWACGEWLNYSFKIPTATNYNVTFRVHGTNIDGKFHLEYFNKQVGVAKVVKARSGWALITISNVYLHYGNRTLKLVCDEGDFMLDYITIEKPTTISTTTKLRRSTEVEDPETIKQDLLVYPNPVAQNLNVELPTAAKDLKIFNAVGKLVYSQSIFNSSNKMSLDVSQFEPGIYMLKSGSDVEKFTIQ